MPKRTHSKHFFQLKNSTNKTPTLIDVQNGKIQLSYQLNGKKVQAKLISCIVVHIAANGNIQPPYECTNKGKGSSVQDYLKRLVLGQGD